MHLNYFFCLKSFCVHSASNHLNVTDVYLNTTWVLPTIHLEPGTRYYVTVRAWSEAGLQTTAVSDGFLVDVTPPLPGVVFVSGHHSNRHAQSSTSTISASWHGFEDRHSGVMSYYVAVYEADDVTVSLMSFTDVRVKTEVRLQNLTLQHQHRFVSFFLSFFFSFCLFFWGGGGIWEPMLLFFWSFSSLLLLELKLKGFQYS